MPMVTEDAISLYHMCIALDATAGSATHDPQACSGPIVQVYMYTSGMFRVLYVEHVLLHNLKQHCRTLISQHASMLRSGPRCT